MRALFDDRAAAGVALGAALAGRRGADVVTAKEGAVALDAPLERAS